MERSPRRIRRGLFSLTFYAFYFKLNNHNSDAVAQFLIRLISPIERRKEMGEISGFHVVAQGHPPSIHTVSYRYRVAEGTLKMTPVVDNNEFKPGDNLVIITTEGIRLAESISKDPKSGKIDNIVYVEGMKTGPIVDLFLKREDTKIFSTCSEELKKFDPRWKQETVEVLKRIGNDHPIFIIPDPLKWGLTEDDLQCPAE